MCRLYNHSLLFISVDVSHALQKVMIQLDKRTYCTLNRCMATVIIIVTGKRECYMMLVRITMVTD